MIRLSLVLFLAAVCGPAIAQSYGPGPPPSSSTTLPTATVVSAAGSTQGTATVLTTQFDVVTTVAAGTGVEATSGYTKIWNAGANVLLVYPISGAQFDAVGTNLPISVPVGGAVETNMTSSTQGYAR